MSRHCRSFIFPRSLSPSPYNSSTLRLSRSSFNKQACTDQPPAMSYRSTPSATARPADSASVPTRQRSANPQSSPSTANSAGPSKVGLLYCRGTTTMHFTPLDRLPLGLCAPLIRRTMNATCCNHFESLTSTPQCEHTFRTLHPSVKLLDAIAPSCRAHSNCQVSKGGLNLVRLHRDWDCTRRSSANARRRLCPALPRHKKPVHVIKGLLSNGTRSHRLRRPDEDKAQARYS